MIAPAKVFSFIIPSYNDYDGLKRHLEFFSGRKESVELIIVDDNSSDDTPKLFHQVTFPENMKVQYIRQAKNCGAGVARNIGIQAATGDYVSFVDADDILADCYFKYIQMSGLENGADVAVFKYHLSDDHKIRYTYRMHKLDSAFFSGIPDSGFPNGTFKIDDLPSVLRIINFPWNKVYKREFLLSAHIEFPPIRMNEDIAPHWQSLIRAKTFSVMAWAPPLITHFESKEGTRATNYIGQDRMPVFSSLTELKEEISTLENSEILSNELKIFTDDFFLWLTNVLCGEDTEESHEWRQTYQDAIDDFRENTPK